MQTPAEYVIGKFGGLTKTARALGVPISTVQGWKERGKVPQEHWLPLIEAAGKNGDALEVTDFLKDHEEPSSEVAA
ncbi:hypothetical protein FHS21_001297 [Phyllobacterium trifolii]|uniref:Uncharacterized protein n=1 Tax=Phyllobacterium trifolii TaxID=300193 RepID=A0A839U1Q6_9HYPH|nr:hypothetical protein [Phyllobacterium trifolii]MBB3144896.1 hypothetical protein [Phyllobacterium trifolii]